MNIQKRESESFLDWKLRLITAKIDKTIDLDWSEISELLQLNCSGDHLRKTSYGIYEYAKYFESKVVDNISDDKLLKEYEIKRVELEKEKQKFFDQRTAYNKIIRDNARLDELKSIIYSSVENLSPYNKLNYQDIKTSDNDLLVGLNDIHFGVEIDNFWNKYNSTIAKERLEKYLNEIISIQKVHNAENCFVCSNGDLISGAIHYTIALANKENVVEQVMGVSELISWFLSELSNHFKNIYFTVVAGNHSRLNIKENSPKNERLDDLIPFYIKARLQNIENIHIVNNNVDNTMSLVSIRGLNYLNVHGDMDRMDSILRLIEMLPQKIYGIVFGHLHHNATNFTQGYKVIMSGSLMGIDDYCIEKRILGKPQQLVCVCTDVGIKCSYDILLD